MFDDNVNLQQIKEVIDSCSNIYNQYRDMSNEIKPVEVSQAGEMWASRQSEPTPEDLKVDQQIEQIKQDLVDNNNERKEEIGR
jgi:hypothetical protein